MNKCSKKGCNDEKYSTSSYCKLHHSEYNRTYLKDKYGSVRSGKLYDYYANNYPAPRKSVYAITNGSGMIEYIGESRNTSFRVYQHLKSSGILRKKNIDNNGYRYVILWSGDNDLLRKIKERELIQQFQPVLNTNLKKRKYE